MISWCLFFLGLIWEISGLTRCWLCHSLAKMHSSRWPDLHPCLNGPTKEESLSMVVQSWLFDKELSAWGGLCCSCTERKYGRILYAPSFKQTWVCCPLHHLHRHAPSHGNHVDPVFKQEAVLCQSSAKYFQLLLIRELHLQEKCKLLEGARRGKTSWRHWRLVESIEGAMGCWSNARKNLRTSHSLSSPGLPFGPEAPSTATTAPNCTSMTLLLVTYFLLVLFGQWQHQLGLSFWDKLSTFTHTTTKITKWPATECYDKTHSELIPHRFLPGIVEPPGLATGHPAEGKLLESLNPTWMLQDESSTLAHPQNTRATKQNTWN